MLALGQPAEHRTLNGSAWFSAMASDDVPLAMNSSRGSAEASSSGTKVLVRTCVPTVLTV